MKLTEAKLKQLIKEVMITPDPLISKVLADPEVHPKIKDLLSSDVEADVRQGFSLLDATLGDRYDVKHASPAAGRKGYKEKFDQFSSEVPELNFWHDIPVELEKFNMSIGHTQDEGLELIKTHQFGEASYIVSVGVDAFGDETSHGYDELAKFRKQLEKTERFFVDSLYNADGGGYYFEVYPPEDI